MALPRLGAFIGEVTFLPADPPRSGAFALRRPAPGFAPLGLVRLWTTGARGVTTEEMEAGLAAASAAIPWLARYPIRGSGSLLAWRAVVRAGLALVAHGRLRPSVSPAGYDCWTIGPLDDEDAGLLRPWRRRYPPRPMPCRSRPIPPASTFLPV